MKRTLASFLCAGVIAITGCGDYKNSKKVGPALEEVIELANNPGSVYNKKKPDKGLEWYFLQGEELDGVEIAKDPNHAYPEIASLKELSQFRTSHHLYENLIGKADIKYITKNTNEEASIQMRIYEFENEINCWDLAETLQAYKGLPGYHKQGFIKDKIFIKFESSEAFYGHEPHEALIYSKILLNYFKRTGAEPVAGKGNHYGIYDGNSFEEIMNYLLRLFSATKKANGNWLEEEKIIAKMSEEEFEKIEEKAKEDYYSQKRK